MTTLTLEHEPLNEVVTLIDEDGRRLCACGCGEPMKPDAKRSYIHGHKIRQEEGYVQDDPEPSDEAKAKATVRVTAKIRKEMQETIEAYLEMASGMFASSDPICGEVLVDQSPKIAEKLVPILARNQAFVRYFRSASSFKEGMDLMIVLYPVAKVVAAHHIFHTINRSPEGQTMVMDYSGYGA